MLGGCGHNILGRHAGGEPPEDFAGRVDFEITGDVVQVEGDGSGWCQRNIVEA